MDHPKYEFSNIGAKLDLTTGIILMNQYADLKTFIHQENLVTYQNNDFKATSPVFIIYLDDPAEYVDIDLSSAPMTIYQKYNMSMIFNIVQAVLLMLVFCAACYMRMTMKKMKSMVTSMPFSSNMPIDYATAGQTDNTMINNNPQDKSTAGQEMNFYPGT